MMLLELQRALELWWEMQAAQPQQIWYSSRLQAPAILISSRGYACKKGGFLLPLGVFIMSLLANKGNSLASDAIALIVRPIIVCYDRVRIDYGTIRDA